MEILKWINKLSYIINEIKRTGNDPVRKKVLYSQLEWYCEELVEIYQITIK